MDYSFGEDGTIFRGSTPKGKKKTSGNPVADKMAEIQKNLHPEDSKLIQASGERITQKTDTPPVVHISNIQEVEKAILEGEIRESILGLNNLKDIAKSTSNVDIQSILLKHSCSQVRAALAKNTKINARILAVLAGDIDEEVRNSAKRHKRYHEIANYSLLDSVSQGKNINWETDLRLIEDMYLSNYNGKKDKYDFSKWPDGWMDTLASLTTREDVQVALCREKVSVRIALANNPKPSSALLYQLAFGKSKNVIYVLLNRTDIDDDVKKWASRRLRELSPAPVNDVKSNNSGCLSTICWILIPIAALTIISSCL